MNDPHGGDTTGYRLRYGRAPLDFSASLNPLGMPPAVKRAALDAVENADAYPDPHARALTAALAEKLGTDPRHVMVGNGSADLIYRYVQAAQPRTALLPVPSFAEYERALRSAGCAIRYHTLKRENTFDLDARILDALSPEVDVLFLCQPNNPTGRLVDGGLLDGILEKCGQTGTRLFLDECFVPFVAGANRVSRLAGLPRYPGLFILGSFTKLYAMAGLRLGYGLCGDAPLLEKMALGGQPWAVSTVAQAAGVAALGQDAYVEESLALVESEKAWLVSGLVALGVTVLGGAANYLFFTSDNTTLDEQLAQVGILVRSCANFRGLGPGYYRIAVRTRAENERLLRAMDGLL